MGWWTSEEEEKKIKQKEFEDKCKNYASGAAMLGGVLAFAKGCYDKSKISQVFQDIEKDKKNGQIAIEKLFGKTETLLKNVEKHKVSIQKRTILRFILLFNKLKKANYTPISGTLDKDIENLSSDFERNMGKIKSLKGKLDSTANLGQIALNAGEVGLKCYSYTGNAFLAAGPTVLLGGIMYAKQSSEDLTKALEERARLQVEIEKAKAAASNIHTLVESKANELTATFTRLDKLLSAEIDKFEKIVDEIIPEEAQKVRQRIASLEDEIKRLEEQINTGIFVFRWLIKIVNTRKINKIKKGIETEGFKIKTLSYLSSSDHRTIALCCVFVKYSKRILESPVIDSNEKNPDYFKQSLSKRQKQVFEQVNKVEATIRKTSIPLFQWFVEDIAKPCTVMIFLMFFSTILVYIPLVGIYLHYSSIAVLTIIIFAGVTGSVIERRGLLLQ